MKIGFALNEALALLTVITGLLALAWRLQRTPSAGRPWWVAWGADLFTVVALVFGCRVALADWMHVPSGSMEPTLRVGDVLLINHLAYGPRLPFTNTAWSWGDPARGDVLVFRHPEQPSEFLVKRVVGLPGDRVRFDRGVVSVNGQPVQVREVGPGQRPEDRDQRLLRERLADVEHDIKLGPSAGQRVPLNIGAPDCTQDGPARWHCTVPAGTLLMLGDNRDNSADSRVFGFLPLQEVYGRVDRVIVNTREWSRWWTAL